MSALTRLPDRRLIGLGAALAVSAALLLAPPVAPKQSAPVSAALAWPHARTGAVPAVLSDGAAFTPLMFVDAQTSVGTAPSPDGATLRLLRRGGDGSVVPIRALPRAEYPSFRSVTADGQRLAWVEDTGNGAHLSLWTVDLGDHRPPRRLTDVTSDAVFVDDFPHDLTLHDGTVYWVAPDPDRPDVTDVHSAPVAGGAVASRAESGDWRLSAWPWLANGTTEPTGTSLLRNLDTGKDVAVHRAAGAQTRCSPSWCEVVSLSGKGSTDVAVMHPDGSAREVVSTGTAVPAVSDVAVLDRFEVLWRTTGNLDLTQNGQLLVADLTTHRTVELSRNAVTVACRDGVLWWSNGDATQAVVTWHTLDLRTV